MRYGSAQWKCSAAEACDDILFSMSSPAAAAEIGEVVDREPRRTGMSRLRNCMSGTSGRSFMHGKSEVWSMPDTSGTCDAHRFRFRGLGVSVSISHAGISLTKYTRSVRGAPAQARTLFPRRTCAVTARGAATVQGSEDQIQGSNQRWSVCVGCEQAGTWPGKARSTSSSANSTYGTCPLAAMRPAHDKTQS